MKRRASGAREPGGAALIISGASDGLLIELYLLSEATQNYLSPLRSRPPKHVDKGIVKSFAHSRTHTHILGRGSERIQVDNHRVRSAL